MIPSSPKSSDTSYTLTTTDKLHQHLQVAFENVLAALVLSGADQGDDVPADAIDAALSTDPRVRIARQALDVALRGLDAPGAGDDRRQAVLALEEAANALVVQSADTTYRLGLRVGRGLRG